MGLFSLFRCRKDSFSLDWIQVEVTSRCNASCLYCPNTIYQDRWRNDSMGMETFNNLVPAFKHAGLIFLQGWGEPFLHPRIFEMIEVAKKAGCMVGSTTNGMTLDEDTTAALIDSELDILGISLAGTKSETHDRIREGTNFECITESLLIVKEQKERKHVTLPVVYLAYLLFRSNFEDLDSLISYATKVGAKEIICSNLTFFPLPDLQKEAIFLDESKKSYYEEKLKSIQANAERNGIRLFFYKPFFDRPLLLCPENVLKSCFISHDGSVSSCVFTNIPLREDEKPDSRCFDKRGYPVRIAYGNVNQQPLSEIWNSDAYREFREAFYQRQKVLKEDLDAAMDAVIYQNSEPEKKEAGAISNLPRQCRDCYRMYGV
ncbi:MAG: radical SAM protein [Deltaproteobacteria bacterium]|nr:radical SAM protein [Deltaproteobacteria bacterium]